MSVDSSPADRGGQKRFGQIFVNLLTVLGVLLIGASALALSYHSGIHERAGHAGIGDPWAWLYPGIFALLLLLAFMSSYVLRAGKRAHRISVDVIIALLVVVGLLAAVEDHLPVRLSEQGEAVTFAAAPWIALLIGILLARWVDTELRVARRSRTAAPEAPPQEGELPQSSPPAEAARDIDWLKDRMRSQTADVDDGATPSGGESATGSTRPPRDEPAPVPAHAPKRREAAQETEESEEAGAEPEPVPRQAPRDSSSAAQSAPAARESSAQPAAGQESSDPASEPEHSEPVPGTDRAAAQEPTEPQKPEPPALPKRTPGTSKPRTVPAPTPLREKRPRPQPTEQQEAAPPLDSAAGDDDVAAEPPDLLLDDPAGDEALLPRGGSVPPPAVASVAAPAEASAAGSGPAPASSAGVSSRPLIRRPRRSTPVQFPEEPPSGRVRSGPTPPTA